MKAKNYLFLLFPITLIGLVFRTFELIYGVEPDTGFYVSGSYLYIFFNVFILIGTLFLLSYIFVFKKDTMIKQSTIEAAFEKSLSPSSVLLGLSAVAILSSSLRKFMLFYLREDFHSFKNIVLSYDFFIFLFGILSAVFLVAFATDAMRCVKSSALNVLSFSLVVYYVIRMFEVFSSPSSILSRAYDSFTILSLGFTVLFFMNFSKMLVGMKSKRYLVSFGMITFFFGIIRAVDLVLFFVDGTRFNISVDPVTATADIIVSVTVCAIVFRLMGARKKIESLNV